MRNYRELTFIEIVTTQDSKESTADVHPETGTTATSGGTHGARVLLNPEAETPDAWEKRPEAIAARVWQRHQGALDKLASY